MGIIKGIIDGRGYKPLANGLDAQYYNPAGIGGVRKNDDRPIIHKLYFPYFSFAVNKDTVKLKQRPVQCQQLWKTQPLLTRFLRAYDGQRQYGRVSVIPSLTFMRTSISYVYDSQFAAATLNDSSDQIDVHSRTVSGPTIGASFSSDDKMLFLGFLAGFFQREEVEANLPLLPSMTQTFAAMPLKPIRPSIPECQFI